MADQEGETPGNRSNGDATMQAGAGDDTQPPTTSSESNGRQEVALARADTATAEDGTKNACRSSGSMSTDGDGEGNGDTAPSDAPLQTLSVNVAERAGSSSRPNSAHLTLDGIIDRAGQSDSSSDEVHDQASFGSKNGKHGDINSADRDFQSDQLLFFPSMPTPSDSLAPLISDKLVSPDLNDSDTRSVPDDPLAHYGRQDVVMMAIRGAPGNKLCADCQCPGEKHE